VTQPVTELNGTEMVAAPETPSGVLALLEELVRSDKPDLLDSSTYAIIARLRRFNREAHNRVNEQRQITLDTRNNMDQTHLGLQNLLYERRHLEREIQKCLDFQSVIHQVMSLIC
jgi:THO complex subunit 5